MSVIIKTSEMQYKDSNGVYHGVNAIAEKKTADMVAEIDTAISAQETRIANDISTMQTAADGIESQRQTMIASIASVAGQGTDTTLTQSGVAADAKVTGDKLNDLKSALILNDNAQSLWEQGGIQSSNGNNSESSTRVRTKSYLPSNLKTVGVQTGYKYIIAAYSGTEYIGMWNGTAYAKTATWLTSKITIDYSNGYSYRIVLAKSADSSISPSDYAGFEMVSVTDTKLNKHGIPADSYVVGSEMSGIQNKMGKWTRLDGTVIRDGYDITSEAVESGTGSFYVADGVVKPTGYSGYSYYKIPIVAGATYYSNKPARWSIFVDDSNSVISYDNNEASIFTAGSGSTYAILSYLSSYDFAVAKGLTPTNHDVIYDLPQSVKPYMSFTDLHGKLTGKMVDGYEKGNLKTDMVLVQDNAYAYASGANASPTIVGSQSNYVIYSLEISNKEYTFKNTRFVLPLDANMKSVSASLSEVTSYDNTAWNAKYLYLSLAKDISPYDTYVISEGDELKVNDTYPDWTGANHLQSEIDSLVSFAPSKVKATGALAESGASIICPVYQEARKGFRLVFNAKITSGTDFEIGFNTSKANITAYPHNKFSVTEHNLVIGVNSYPHGLTIENTITFILESSGTASRKITISSNGHNFVYSQGILEFATISVPYVKSDGIVCTDCSLVYSNSDFNKDIWMIGDSYTAYADIRWPYYANAFGCLDHILLDGFSGMESNQAKLTFPDIVALGTPKIAVWLMGMNDGSDPDNTTPSTAWVSGKDVFLETCANNGIAPVFATIPNVPTINHKGKNYWIRNSGYRYIDFCAAVGADDSNTWYDGMLETSTPRIHPTAQGAIALFNQILVDLPEIMVN